MRRCAESIWETWKCLRGETYVQRTKNMKLGTEMDINIQVQTIKRCQLLNQIYPKTFYIYVPTGQSLVEQIPKVSREEKEQTGCLSLTHPSLPGN